MSSDALAKLRAEIEELRAQVPNLESKLKRCHAQNDDLNTANAWVRGQRDQARERIAALESELAHIQLLYEHEKGWTEQLGHTVGDLQDRLGVLEARLAAVIALAEEDDDYTTFSDILRAAHGHDPRNE